MQKIKLLNITDLLQLRIAIPMFAFTLPLIISGPQLLIGTLVNAMLFLASLKLTKKELLPIAVLPSLGALSHGVLFGSYTPFLLYFLPFIWVGNIILIMSHLELKKSLPLPLVLFFSSLLKASMLYIFALLYFQLHWVPKLFLVSMGTVQFITALLGAILAYTLLKLINTKK